MEGNSRPNFRVRVSSKVASAGNYGTNADDRKIATAALTSVQVYFDCKQEVY